MAMKRSFLLALTIITCLTSCQNNEKEASTTESVNVETVNSNREVESTISDTTNPKTVEEIEASLNNGNYSKIKSDYRLLGKWEISNSFMKQTYSYEIRKKGDEYIGVFPDGDYKTETLEKNGNDYYVQGSRFGEFYRVDANMNMILFDRDGDLTGAGYRAVKM